MKLIKLRLGLTLKLVLNFTFITVSTLSINSIALASIAPFTSKYIAYYDGDDVGEASLSLTKLEGSQYQLNYESTVSKFFLSDRRFETSVFNADGETLTPILYQYRRTGTGSNKSLNVNFNKQDKSILINNETTLEWNGEMDNQLFRVDLSTRLQQGESEFSYDFINYRGEKKHYHFEVQSTDSLDLPYGKLSAIKIKINRRSNKRVTYAWFAPDLDYSLVRLQQFKDGKEQGDIKLQSFSR
jgi:hypothetical protein